MTETSQQTYEGWIGRSETASERIDAWPLRALNAALEINAPVEDGAGIPPLAHWLYFVPLAPRSRVGTDGHPKRGDFLPPITLPRRMWAGSDIVFHGPIAIGDRVEKKSTIADVSVKPGKSGDMIFLKVENAYRVAGALRLAEVQTLVYLDDPKPDAPSPQPKKAPENAAFSDAFSADTVLLFRYSAITFNAHRIHYDAPYARDVEGYPDVVVHGQLTATLLLNAFRRSQSERPVNSFSFRAVKPIFCGSTIVLEGAPDEGGYSLWARDADGHLCVKATVGF